MEGFEDIEMEFGGEGCDGGSGDAGCVGGRAGLGNCLG